MLGRLTVTVASVTLVCVLGSTAREPVRAQGDAASALTGVVSSSEEGAMEGVVVSARRDGANFTVSVVTDAQGRYRFPRTHLDSGSYDIENNYLSKIR